MPLSKGHVLARKYEVIDFLGKGLIFEVYRARHTRLDREVALKVLIPEVAADLEFTRFVIKTIQATASLDAHPHISWVHDIDKDGVYIFFVMDYLPVDLNAVMDKLDVEASVNVALAVLDALSYAHKHGLIHKDIRPSNVRFSESGEPLLVDFGMAEIAAKAAVKFKKTSYLPPPTYAAPPKLDEIVLKAMAHDPAGRFQSAEEMISALTDVKRKHIARFIPGHYEERRPEGAFTVKYRLRENSPVQVAIQRAL